MIVCFILDLRFSQVEFNAKFRLSGSRVEYLELFDVSTNIAIAIYTGESDHSSKLLKNHNI
jgi:hypothetical protein